MDPYNYYWFHKDMTPTGGSDDVWFRGMQNGATLSKTFTVSAGNAGKKHRVDVSAWRNWTSGTIIQLKVYIDNVQIGATQTVSDQSEYQTKMFHFHSSGGYAAGSHTVKVEAVGDSSARVGMVYVTATDTESVPYKYPENPIKLPKFGTKFLTAEHFKYNNLRGVQGNRSMSAQGTTAANGYFTALKNSKANHVRIWLEVDTTSSTTVTFLAGVLTQFKDNLQRAKADGYYLIPSIWVNRNAGNHLGDWGAWSDTKMQSIVNLWTTFLQETGHDGVPYWNEKTIAGLDLWNEALYDTAGSHSLSHYIKWLELMMDACIAAGSQHVFILQEVSGPPVMSQTLPFYHRNNRVVYSIHPYYNINLTHQGMPGGAGYQVEQKYPTASWGYTQLEADFSLSTYVRDKYNIPVYAGEFACSPYAPMNDQGEWSSTRWTKDIIEVMEKKQISWACLAVREFQGWELEVPSSWWRTKYGADSSPYLPFQPGGPGDTILNQAPANRSETAPTWVLLKNWFALNTTEESFFGNHIGGPREAAFVWPTTVGGQPYSLKHIRTWDTFGCNPTVCNAGNGYNYSPLGNGLAWKDIQRVNTGTFDWTLFDLMWDKFIASGVTDIIYTLGRTPAWAQATPNDTKGPDDVSVVGTFITAVANRAILKGLPIKYWEIWNEPEEGSWSDTYTKLYQMGLQVYNAAKAVDPSNKVLSPACQGAGADYWFNFYLAADANAKNTFDIVAFHSYINHRDTTRPLGQRFNNLIDAMKAKMAEYGISNKPLWDTEGFDAFVPNCTNGEPNACDTANTDNPNIQSAYLAQRYLVSAAKGVERVYWYGYDQNLGRQITNNTQNNIALADRVVRGWMIGATVSNFAISGNVYSVDITKDGVTKKAVWYRTVSETTATDSTSYNVGSYTQRETVYGVTSAVSGSITLDKMPILLSGESVGGAPSAPATPTLVSATTSSITINIPAVTGATSYNVIRSASADLSSPTTVTGRPAGTFTASSLPAGTYYFVAQAVNANGTSVNSGTLTARTAVLIKGKKRG